jgi:ATP-dependent Clp protease protease subunit
MTPENTKKKSKEDHPTEATSEGKTEEKDANRNIFLFGRLENEVTLPTIKKLLRLNERDQETPINLYINSAGGNGYNADAIIAVMNQIDAPVNTICLGHALSGACEILASGTGERLSYEFATLMFHQTLWEADGDITNLEIQAAQGLRFREAQIELLHRCTGKEKDKVRKDIERDHYMSAKEALEYGIIDKVISHERKKIHAPKESPNKASYEKTEHFARQSVVDPSQAYTESSAKKTETDKNQRLNIEKKERAGEE